MTRRILAIGGGGFMMEGKRSFIDEQIVALTGKQRPRICVVPTPTGDAESVITAFDEAYIGSAETYVLAPFRKPRANSVPLREIATTLCTMDAVFVTGGNTKSALGVWREWGIDSALRGAYDTGVLISGMSAGASAWFEFCFSDSYYDGYATLPGLGWIEGGFCPHFNGENSARANALRDAITRGQMPATIAVDDYAAVLIENEKFVRSISWRAGCAAYQVRANGQEAIS